MLFRSIAENGHKFEVRVIPESLKDVVLHLGHNQSGHNGYQRTYAAIKHLYYWKGMRTHVLCYCKSCKTCAVQKVLMCICVLWFTLHYIIFRWSHKFVYSPLSFHYKCIVIHSTVSHLVRVKEQINLYKSMGCLSYNFINLRPPPYATTYTAHITLHGDPDQGLQPAEEGGKVILFMALFYKELQFYASAVVGYSIFQTVVNIGY